MKSRKLNQIENIISYVEENFTYTQFDYLNDVEAPCILLKGDKMNRLYKILEYGITHGLTSKIYLPFLPGEFRGVNPKRYYYLYSDYAPWDSTDIHLRLTRKD